MSQPAAIFRALGDESRLTILQRVMTEDPCQIRTVSEGLGMSRQAARKHLHVLESAEIITLEPRGRDVFIRLNPATIQVGRSFLEQVEIRWDGRLQALKRFLEDASSTERT